LSFSGGQRRRAAIYAFRCFRPLTLRHGQAAMPAYCHDISHYHYASDSALSSFTPMIIFAVVDAFFFLRCARRRRIFIIFIADAGYATPFYAMMAIASGR